MSKSDNPSPSDGPAPQPVWKKPVNERQRFKEEHQAWKQQEKDRRYAELAAGPRQFKVSIFDKGGSPNIIEGNNGEKVSYHVVGGSSPDEAIGKFCRFAGITGGMENVKIVG